MENVSLAVNTALWENKQIIMKSFLFSYFMFTGYFPP